MHESIQGSLFESAPLREPAARVAGGTELLHDRVRLARLRESKQGAGIVSPPPRRLYGVAEIDLTGGGAVPRMSLGGWSRL